MLAIVKNPFICYKIAHYLHKRGFSGLSWILTYWIRFFWSAYIPPSAEIGEGTVLGYGGLGIVIHARAVIGRDCHIDQHVTIGGTSKKIQVPVIGNNVYIGAGAKILGPVTIGDHAVIGANAVVVKDIAANSLAVGVPARIVKTDISSSEYI